PLWLGPVTTAGMDAELASYYDRHNPLLASVEGALRENIIESLRSMGVPEARLADPNDLQVASFLGTCLASQRLALDAIESRNKSAPSPHLRIKTNWLVVGALCSS